MLLTVDEIHAQWNIISIVRAVQPFCNEFSTTYCSDYIEFNCITTRQLISCKILEFKILYKTTKIQQYIAPILPTVHRHLTSKKTTYFGINNNKPTSNNEDQLKPKWQGNSLMRSPHTMIGYLLSSKYLLVASEALNWAPEMIRTRTIR